MYKIGLFHIPNTLNNGSMMMAENFMWYSLILSKKKLSFIIPTPNIDETQLRLRGALGNEIRFECISCQFTRDTSFKHILKNSLFSSSFQNIIHPKILGCDAIVVLGGDDFTESYSHYGALIELFTLTRIKFKLKKPVCLIGQTIGPFSSFRNKIAINLLKQFNLITCRDLISFNYLKAYGLSNVYQTADLAFLPLAKENISLNDNMDERFIVLVPSRLLINYMPYVSYEEYIKSWCALISFLLNTFENKLVLLPHAKGDPINDDRLIVKDIYIALKREGCNINRVMVVNDILLPYETRRIFKKSLLAITSRMHAAISALSQGVIPISLGYSEKYIGVVGKGFSLEELVIDVRQCGSLENLLQKVIKSIRYAMSNRNTLLECILQNMIEMRKKSLNNVEFFFNQIKWDDYK